ncbi:unnamed protein product [Closterium sp. NIES-64]|nr:unnamed protein product [Closterium sp. NIES-64]
MSKGIETGKGWFGVGFSSNGKMNGDAIIADSMRAGAPKLLTLVGHTSRSDATGWTPTGLKITKNPRGTTIEFTGTTSDGREVALNPSGNNYITWASANSSVTRGHAVIDLSCNGCAGTFVLDVSFSSLGSPHHRLPFFPVPPSSLPFTHSGHAVLDLSCNGCAGTFRKALCKAF